MAHCVHLSDLGRREATGAIVEMEGVYAAPAVEVAELASVPIEQRRNDAEDRGDTLS
jgi:hypothetical protein